MARRKPAGRLLVTMAWRNLGRNRRRTAITLTAMTLGVGLCIPMYGLMDGLTAHMARTITQVHLGHIQVHTPGYVEDQAMTETFPAEVAGRVARVRGVLAVSGRVYTGGMITAEQSFRVRFRALGAGPGRLRIEAGRRVNPRRCEVLLPERLARSRDLDLGSVLRLDPLPVSGPCEELEVVGLVAGEAALVPARVLAALAREAQGDLGGRKGAEDWDIDHLPKLAPARPAGMEAPPRGRPRSAGTEGSGRAGRSADGAASEAGRKDGVAAARQKGREARAADGASAGSAALPGRAGRGNNLSGALEWRLVRAAALPVGVVAVDPKAESRVTFVAEHLVKGRYLPEKVSAKGPMPLLVSENLARRLAVGVGDTVGMDLMTPEGYPVDGLFRVWGLFRTGVDDLDRGLVFVPLQVAWSREYVGLVDPKTGRGLYHELAVRIRRGERASVVAARIRQALGPGLLVRTWRQVDPDTARLLQYQDAAIAVFLGIIFVIAALGTANTMLMAVHERTKEFGVLKSIGLKPVQVAGLILLETLFLVLAAGLLGGLLGAGLDAWLVAYGLDLTRLNPGGFTYQGIVLDPVWRATLTAKVVALPVGILMGVSLLVSVWPAVRAGRIRPVVALRMQG